MNGANTTGSTALLPWIQEVCASERRLEAHLADLKQLEEGSLHIIAFTSTLTQWLPQITKRFTEAHPHIDLRITCCDDQAQLEHIAKSRSRRNRARRRRALCGPSSSARKAGSAKPTKENPRRCCFRGIKKRGRGQSRPRFACAALYFMIPISKARMRTTATRSRATGSPGLRYLPVGSS